MHLADDTLGKQGRVAHPVGTLDRRRKQLTGDRPRGLLGTAGQSCAERSRTGGCSMCDVLRGSTSRRTILLAGLLLGAMALASVTGGGQAYAQGTPAPTAEAQPAATSEPRPIPSDPDDDPAEDPGVVSLTRDYGISTEQSIAQMESQVGAGRAELALDREFRAAYSGWKIDHADGGQVTVGSADADRSDELRAHFERHGASQVEVLLVAYSEDELDQLAEQLQLKLMDDRRDDGSAALSVGRGELGRITIQYVPGAELTNDERQILGQALDDPQRFSIEQVELLEAEEADACDRSGNIECDPPLRGSVWIANGNVCTAGFNARSSSDDLPYVITASHCDQNSGDYRTQFEDESNHDIGPFHSSIAGPHTDAGILRVDNPTGWSFGKPWVTVNPSNGGHAANDTYGITQVQDPGLDARVCVTAGNFPGTTCGDVIDTNTAGVVSTGLFETTADLCLMGGDSGSPYFSYGVAYGIHSSSQDGSNCGEWGKAEHATEAENTMNVYILTN